MLTENKITEIFFMADEFCKVFDEMLHGKGLATHNPMQHHILIDYQLFTA